MVQEFSFELNSKATQPVADAEAVINLILVGSSFDTDLLMLAPLKSSSTCPLFIGHPHTGPTGGYGSLHTEESSAVHWGINSFELLDFFVVPTCECRSTLLSIARCQINN